MIEEQGNLFAPGADAYVITTNGALTSNDLAVMGRGVALQASRMVASLRADLGAHIIRNGNTPALFNYGNNLMTFPVKLGTCVVTKPTDVITRYRSTARIGQILPGWMGTADIGLIEESAQKIANIAKANNFNKIYMPRPGCGNGELDWEEQVKPILKYFLDDTFIIRTL